MKPINRKRSQIIDLDTGKTYLNESMIEKDLGISRYFIHKSLKEGIPVKNRIFAYYSYEMDIDNLREYYLKNHDAIIKNKQEKKILRSEKWKNLTKLMEEKGSILI